MKLFLTSLFTLCVFTNTHAGEKSKTHTFTGLFQTGIVAIGGETTGTQLDGMTSGPIELKLTQASGFSEKLNDSLVTVKGDFEKVSGVETGDRNVLNVKSIEFHFDLKTLRGQVSPIAAIGGETSGWQIKTKEGKEIELALTENQKEALNSHLVPGDWTMITAVVVGKKVTLKGIARKSYSAFAVQELNIQESIGIPEHPAGAPTGAVENSK